MGGREERLGPGREGRAPLAAVGSPNPSALFARDHHRCTPPVTPASPSPAGGDLSSRGTGRRGPRWGSWWRGDSHTRVSGGPSGGRLNHLSGTSRVNLQTALEHAASRPALLHRSRPPTLDVAPSEARRAVTHAPADDRRNLAARLSGPLRPAPRPAVSSRGARAGRPSAGDASSAGLSLVAQPRHHHHRNLSHTAGPIARSACPARPREPCRPRHYSPLRQCRTGARGPRAIEIRDRAPRQRLTLDSGA